MVSCCCGGQGVGERQRGTICTVRRELLDLFLQVSQYIYRMFQNICHKLFLGIPHPKISKNVPINMGPKMNRFRDINLRSCAGTLLSIT